MDRALRYMNWYPLASMSVKSLVMPDWDQSLPIAANTWPSTSLFVMVPSMSEMTSFVSHGYRYTYARHCCRPHSEDRQLYVMTFCPSTSGSSASCSGPSVRLRCQRGTRCSSRTGSSLGTKSSDSVATTVASVLGCRRWAPAAGAAAGSPAAGPAPSRGGAPFSAAAEVSFGVWYRENQVQIFHSLSFRLVSSVSEAMVVALWM